MRSDAEIKRDVGRELPGQADRDRDHTAISVQDGVALLAGLIRSYVDNYEAERVAKRGPPGSRLL